MPATIVCLVFGDQNAVLDSSVTFVDLEDYAVKLVVKNTQSRTILPQWLTLQYTHELFGNALLVDDHTLGTALKLNSPLVVTITLRIPSNARDDIALMAESRYDLARQQFMHQILSAPSPSTGFREEHTIKTLEECPMWCGRPSGDHTGPPLAIYHSVFGVFADQYGQVPPENISPVDLRSAHELFVVATEMCYDEYDRETEMQRCLQHGLLIPFVKIGHTRETFCPDPSDGAAPIVIGSTPVHVIWVNVKNEISSGGAEPLMEAALALSKHFSGDEMVATRENTCCPSFILLIVGPHLMVCGFVLADQAIIQPLTDYIYIGDGHGSATCDRVRKVAHLFEILRGCYLQLQKYYCRPPRSGCFPFWIDFPDRSSGDTRYMEYVDRLTPEYSWRAAFEAKEISLPSSKTPQSSSASVQSSSGLSSAAASSTSKGSDSAPGRRLVVKFVKNYGEAAHALLADANLAPKFHGVRAIPGGLNMVVMDYIDGMDAHALMQASNDGLPSTVEEDVRAAVALVHGATPGLVLGDVRLPNIMIYTEEKDGVLRRRAMMIDFDWAGEEGQARYPPTLNSDSPDFAGAERGKLITKKNDEDMLDILVKQMRQRSM